MMIGCGEMVRQTQWEAGVGRETAVPEVRLSIMDRRGTERGLNPAVSVWSIDFSATGCWGWNYGTSNGDQAGAGTVAPFGYQDLPLPDGSSQRTSEVNYDFDHSLVRGATEQRDSQSSRGVNGTRLAGSGGREAWIVGRIDLVSGPRY
jgi:hypothetical protein